MPLTIPEYMSLKDGDYVAIGLTRYVVDGLSDLNEPQLVDCKTGIILFAAIYVTHLMYRCGSEPEPEKKKMFPVYSEEEDVAEPVREAAVLEQPVKKKRGRPRKNPL